MIAGALVCAPALMSAPQEQAQAQQRPPQSAYRLLDPDRMLQGSLLGQQIIAQNAEAEQALDAENTALAEQLIVEERDLTALRASLTPEEFRARADAFEERVDEIRAERSLRSTELTRQSEAALQQFFDRALPVLDQLMADEGIIGLIRPDMMILWAEWLDVTDLAIARLDATFADGGQTQRQP